MSEQMIPASAKFTKLTAFLDELKENEYGDWHFSEGHKGTTDDPIPFPYPIYSETVHRLIKAVYEFEENPEYNLMNYLDTIDKAGIKFDAVEPEKLDSYQTMAALYGIMRQERFCDGLILSSLKNGTVQKLLMRLKDIDTETA